MLSTEQFIFGAHTVSNFSVILTLLKPGCMCEICFVFHYFKMLEVSSGQFLLSSSCWFKKSKSAEGLLV